MDAVTVGAIPAATQAPGAGLHGRSAVSAPGPGRGRRGRFLGLTLAFLLFYAIIAGAGAAYASLVTYLVPPVALLYGAIFLGERFGAAALGGLVLILGGVALGTGGGLRRSRLQRRAPSEA